MARYGRKERSVRRYKRLLKHKSHEARKMGVRKGASKGWRKRRMT